MTRLDYAELNSTIRYTMWSVFRVEPGRLPADRAEPAREAQHHLEALEGKGVVVRGVYDLAGLRADADWMIWWHAATADALQEAYATFPRHRAGPATSSRSGRTWRCTAPPSSTRATCRRSWPVRTPGRTSASTRSCAPTSGTCCRSGAARAAGRARQEARDYPDVRANTVASFALGDYEWILAFEADELHRIVDLMRAAARLGDPPPRPGGGAVLHRSPGSPSPSW